MIRIINIVIAAITILAFSITFASAFFMDEIHDKVGGQPSKIVIEKGLFKEKDVVLIMEYGERRITLTPDEIFDIVENAKFDRFSKK